MQRISMVDEATAPEPVRAAIHEQIAKNGRVTHMKRTLLHALPAYRAYMEWYTLRDELQAFLPPRTVLLYAHAISTQTHCLICSTFFRRIIIESGEDPENIQLTPKEDVLVAYGRQLAADANGVSDALFARLQEFFRESEIVLITAFAGLMIATNLFNNALKIPLDPYLEAYKDARIFNA